VKSDLRTAALYLLAFLPTAILASVANFLTLVAASMLLPRATGPWVVIAVNILPSAAVGGAVYGALTRRRQVTRVPPSHHLVRSAPLYIVALGLGSVLAREWSDPAFGFVAQLIVWPLATALGNILADAVVSRGQHVRGPALAV
jgi:hypothetical protein